MVTLFSRDFEPRRTIGKLLLSVLAIALLGGLCGEAVGKSRSRGKSSAAASAAKRQKTIQSIQKQVNEARQVLQTAESQAGMSEKEINAAKEKINAARTALENARAAEQNARSALREIETKLLNAKPGDPKYQQAQAAVDEAQKAVDRVLHQTVPLPQHSGGETTVVYSSELRSLSPENRAALKDSVDHQLAVERLNDAKANLTRAKNEMFRRSPEWVEASEAVAEAHKEESSAGAGNSTPGLGMVAIKNNLRTSQDIAAAARRTIAQGEAMLKQLGVKDVGKNAGQWNARPLKSGR